MSDFLTLGQVTGGLGGTAPQLWVASTDDDLAAITTAGYVADKVTTVDGTPGVLSVGDVMTISYDDDGTPTTQMFLVTSTSGGSLVVWSVIGNAALSSIGGLTTIANEMLYTTAPDVYAVTAITALARTLIATSTAATFLAALGIYFNRSTGAGGSASVTITDANISSTSIVLAQFQTSANAVSVEKVTAGSGSAVVLCSGDPGANTMNYIVLPDTV